MCVYMYIYIYKNVLEGTGRMFWKVPGGATLPVCIPILPVTGACRCCEIEARVYEEYKCVPRGIGSRLSRNPNFEITISQGGKVARSPCPCASRSGP